MIDKILDLITKLIYFFLTPIVNLIYSAFPNLDNFIPLIHDFFNTISRFILYIVDLSMIYPVVWAFLIGSIIYRITYSYIIVFTKIIVKWWHYLVP